MDIKIDENASLDDIKKDMMTIKETAEFFGVKADYVRSVLCHIKGFPYVRIGKRYFIHKKGLEKWIERHYGDVFRSDLQGY